MVKSLIQQIFLISSYRIAQLISAQECLLQDNLSNILKLTQPEELTNTYFHLHINLNLVKKQPSFVDIEIDKLKLANVLRNYYTTTVTSNCPKEIDNLANCCQGFSELLADDIEITGDIDENNPFITQNSADGTSISGSSAPNSGTLLGISYKVKYNYNFFRNCPETDYANYYTDDVSAGNNILSSFNQNTDTRNIAEIYNFNSYSLNNQEICSKLVANNSPCSGNSICHIDSNKPEASCVSVCNEVEYRKLYDEPYCFHDFTCCQTDLNGLGVCQCELYDVNSFSFIFGNRCQTKIPLWAAILIIIGIIIFILLTIILLIYCCCPACCPCCFRKRIERMKQNRLEKLEKDKKKEEAKIKAKLTKNSTPRSNESKNKTPIQTTFYGNENSAYLPDNTQHNSGNTQHTSSGGGPTNTYTPNPVAIQMPASVINPINSRSQMTQPYQVYESTYPSGDRYSGDNTYHDDRYEKSLINGQKMSILNLGLGNFSSAPHNTTWQNADPSNIEVPLVDNFELAQSSSVADSSSDRTKKSKNDPSTHHTEVDSPKDDDDDGEDLISRIHSAAGVLEIDPELQNKNMIDNYASHQNSGQNNANNASSRPHSRKPSSKPASREVSNEPSKPVRSNLDSDLAETPSSNSYQVGNNPTNMFEELGHPASRTVSKDSKIREMGGVPSIGPNFENLMMEVKDHHHKSRSQSREQGVVFKPDYKFSDQDNSQYRREPSSDRQTTRMNSQTPSSVDKSKLWSHPELKQAGSSVEKYVTDV